LCVDLRQSACFVGIYDYLVFTHFMTLYVYSLHFEYLVFMVHTLFLVFEILICVYVDYLSLLH